VATACSGVAGAASKAAAMMIAFMHLSVPLVPFSIYPGSNHPTSFAQAGTSIRKAIFGQHGAALMAHDIQVSLRPIFPAMLRQESQQLFMRFLAGSEVIAPLCSPSNTTKNAFNTLEHPKWKRSHFCCEYSTERLLTSKFEQCYIALTRMETFPV
jgi:hypothetical protein